MTKQCAQCHKTFKIEEQDIVFYKKINVPEPILCSNCRMQRRMALRNELNLYQDNCDLCKKNIISLYSEDKPYKVYCYDCFYSDKWDAINEGCDFDFSVSFFKQFKQLQLKVPRIYAFATNNENSEYTNGSAYNKNCYMMFVSDHNENCFYSYSIFRCRDCMDCINSYNLESCYECSSCENCFGSKYTTDSFGSNALIHCIDCKGCSDCFGCVGLRNKQNYFLNKALNTDEYKKRIINITDKEILEFKKLKLKHSFRYIHGLKNENVSGDYLNNCISCNNCYDSHYLENCKNTIHGNKAKDSQDNYVLVDNSELIYESVGIINSYNCKFNYMVFHSQNAEFCDFCTDSKDIFGCIALKRKQYCIFNKQYNKSEYFKLREKIIQCMKKNGEYGELLPIKNSPFAYNETVAVDYYPLNKENALSNDWQWFNTEKKKINFDLPICENCSQNFIITTHEEEFYRKNNLSKPVNCFKCRHKNRLTLRNPRSLWHRQCMKPDCHNTFETTYSPDRKELVYCEECYLSAVM